ncbi:MAG: zinc metallopeptidase [Coriobacteriia bacterium]|nr:zinc metallopeptidase [Coriobacteriia bacterium]
MFGINSSWILLMVVSLVLGLITRGYINSAYRRWSGVPLSNGLTGAEVAERVLAANGISGGMGGPTVSGMVEGRTRGVRIQPIGGNLSDHYDPRTKVISLSEGIYGVSSVAAAGVAAHEAGHAVQDAQGYVWNRVRTALVPVANFGSSAAWVMIFFGLFFGLGSAFGQAIVLLGIAFYAFAVLFQIVTLPVEINASKRAMVALESTGVLQPAQLGGARQVLTAAALTYVAAALIAVLQLLYLMGLLRRD